MQKEAGSMNGPADQSQQNGPESSNATWPRLGVFPTYRSSQVSQFISPASVSSPKMAMARRFVNCACRRSVGHSYYYGMYLPMWDRLGPGGGAPAQKRAEGGALGTDNWDDSAVVP